MILVAVVEPDASLHGLLWSRLAALGPGVRVVAGAAELRFLRRSAPTECLVIARGDGTAANEQRIARSLRSLSGDVATRLIIVDGGADHPSGRALAAYLHEVDRVIAGELFHRGGELPADLAPGQRCRVVQPKLRTRAA